MDPDPTLTRTLTLILTLQTAMELRPQPLLLFESFER